MGEYISEEELIRQRRRARQRARMRREKQRRRKRIRLLVLCVSFLLLLLLIIGIFWGIIHLLKGKSVKNDEIKAEEMEASSDGILSGNSEKLKFSCAEVIRSFDSIPATEEMPFPSGYTIERLDSADVIVTEDVQSTYALLIDLDESTVIAQKNAYDRIVPASMTKILTVLVAAEHITDLQDTFTITQEITDYSYVNDCSAVGFSRGETVTVEDLLYGTILPSGADAAAGLAYYVSGSLEGFVDLMNQKLAELGLSNTTHFTNCVGLYDENHYSTCYDMAIILKAAIENDLCRKVLSAHIYTTSSTEAHPEGIEMSNWFLRRIEDKETNGEVVCGKTGYVTQSGNCAASYAVSDSGKHYICVTADAHSSWRCIYDQVEIFQEYLY